MDAPRFRDLAGSDTRVVSVIGFPHGCDRANVKARAAEIAVTDGAREIDTATMAAASLFVDARESALNEAGDYLLAAKEGAIGPNHIKAELGEVLIGASSGRTSVEEITLFKSLGLAIEDLAAAAFVYQQAQAATIGSWVDF